MGNFMPLVDQQQNYNLLSLSESEGQTIMTFQRSIQSCDDQDFHITVRHSDIISQLLTIYSTCVVLDAKLMSTCSNVAYIKYQLHLNLNKFLIDLSIILFDFY